MVQEQTVNKPENVQATPNLTPAQEALQALWEKHGYELVLTALKMLATMVEDAYVNHVPVMTGESEAAVGEFYSTSFHRSRQTSN